MSYSVFGNVLFASIDAQRRPRSVSPPIDGAPDMDQAIVVLFAAGGIIVLFGIIVLILRQFLFICRPNEILVFSGRRHVLPDGTVSGYKILHGGRGVRLPFLETVSRMDMRLFPVEVQVHNAYSKGGIPLSVHAIANVKIASSDTGVRNAVEPLRKDQFDGPTRFGVAAKRSRVVLGYPDIEGSSRRPDVIAPVGAPQNVEPRAVQHSGARPILRDAREGALLRMRLTADPGVGKASTGQGSFEEERRP